MWKSLKRWPVLLALCVAVGMLAVAVAWLPYGSRVTRENCERIKEGMTEAEVRAIVGKPWEDSLLDPELTTFMVDLSGPAWYSQLWIGDDCEMFVMFDENGRVMDPQFIPDPNRPRTWLPVRVWRRLRARYGW
jgi:hypothetical protein